MNAVEVSLEILRELEGALKTIDPAQTEALVDAIIAANSVFVAGTGRSLLMIRSLAVRLMQLGFKAYVVGETVTPAIGPGDLLIIGSGSGETGTLVTIAHKAKKVGAKLGLMTVYADSSIGRLADITVQIKAATTKSDKDSGAKSFQPGANMFEQSLLLLCDAITIRLIEVNHIDDSNAKLMRVHANLE